MRFHRKDCDSDRMFTSEIVNQAINYIMQHVNEPITIDEVAEYCHFSKYYFCRLFKAETGESVHAFIVRMKLEQSAFRLKVEQKRSITDIGCDYGYSASNYSTAFRKHHHTSPADFRKDIFEKSAKHPSYHGKPLSEMTYEECCNKVKIKELPDYYAVYERRFGNYRSLAEEWHHFTEKYSDYITENTVFLERSYDDPSITDEDNCIYDFYMAVDRDCPLTNTCVIQGGKFAVYSFQGCIEQIYAAYQALFQIWFPHNSYEIDERYGFGIYHTVDCETMYVEMDICVPVR